MSFSDPSRNSADYSTVDQIQKRMLELCDKMDAMAPDVAKAHQIRDHDSDRRKSALGDAVRSEMMKELGLSAALAEHRARSNPEYKKRMADLAADLMSAESHIINFDITKTRWETARSLLSIQKKLVEQL